MTHVLVPTRLAAGSAVAVSLLLMITGLETAAAQPLPVSRTILHDTSRMTADAARWDVTGVSTRRRYGPSHDPVEQRLTDNAIAVHRAALVAWPEITTYYGYRNDPTSDHYTGKALDLMISGYTTTKGKTLGGNVAAWAVANQPGLHIQYVIWNQHIWNVSRASEGWRLMPDRGSDSANHKNHVHISVQ